jgi:methyl-accepting chemotaxis protein
VSDGTHSMIWTLWITTLVSAVGGGLLAMTIARRISRGVRTVVDRATAIAHGNLTGAPLAIEDGDEVGMLADAMQRMQANLRKTIGAVACTAASVTSGTVSIGASGEEMRRKMDEQNQQTDMTVAAMQEMSATAAEVSRHASSSATNARAAAETAAGRRHRARDAGGHELHRRCGALQFGDDPSSGGGLRTDWPDRERD